MWYFAASLWQQASLGHSTTRVRAIPVPAVPVGGYSVEHAQPAETVTPERNLLAGTVRGLGVAKDLADLVCSCQVREVTLQGNRGGVGGQVVQRDHAAITPARLDGQDTRVADRDRAPLAPAEFRALAAHAHGPSDPGVQRVGVVTLVEHVDGAVAVEAVRAGRPVQPAGGGEAAGVPWGPLHRVADGDAAWQ